MRLFLAIELPTEVGTRLRELQERLRRSCPGWRWVRPEGIHLTLRFLGEVDPADDRQLRGLWRGVSAAHPPLRFEIGGLGVFPGGARPRVLWVGVQETFPGGTLPSLAEALELAAREHGFEPEARAFRPHLTLARAEREGRPVPPPPDAVSIAKDVPAAEITLVQSVLDPAGARYTRLEAFPLRGGR